jgi:DNA-binding IclR family transcriptional regulator
MDNLVASGAHRAPAVARAATVLRLLANEAAGMGVSEIARRVGLVPSTCLHVLRALVEEGFVDFDNEKKTYRTGVGLLTLAREALASSDYPKIVQASLERLAEAHKVTAVALELDGRERMVAVGIARSRQLISLHISVGSRFPAYISATGRCVAARSGLSREQLQEKFNAVRWERPPKFEEWYADVERVRREGVAIDRGNYIRGVTIVASLIPQTLDRATRGIALIGFEHEMTEKNLRETRQDLILAVDAIVAKLS